MYGLTRMIMVYLDESRIEMDVFRSVHEARTWLGLPEEYRCPLVNRDAS